MNKKYLLYFDDTGSCDPDHSGNISLRHDKMDCFGLGGIFKKSRPKLIWVFYSAC